MNGSIEFGANTPPPVPPGTPTGASNGLSVDPVSNDAVLGQDVGAAGDPAALLSNRQTIIGPFELHYQSAQGNTDIVVIRAINITVGDTNPAFTTLTDIRDANINLITTVPAGQNIIDLFANALNSFIQIRDVISKSPAIQLEVANGGPLNLQLVNDNGFFRLQGPGVTNRVSVNMTTGNVGIGTATPAARLDVFGTTSPALVAINTSANHTVPASIGASVAAYVVHPSGTFGLAIVKAATNTGGAILNLCKTKSADASINTAVSAGDDLGRIIFQGVGTTATYNQSATFLSQAEAFTGAGAVCGNFQFLTVDTGGSVGRRLFISCNGLVAIGAQVPTALLHLAAGIAAASGAPLKFTAGTNLTAAEAGAVEWDGTNLFVTQTAGPTRKTIAYTTDVPTTASGTYTPTLTNGTNVTSSTANNCTYMRVGSVVTVYGTLSITQTLGNQPIELGISLPVASNFAAATDLNGSGLMTDGTVGDFTFTIIADAANDRASLNQIGSIGGALSVLPIYFSFQYSII